jgi:hypothetical protein
MGEAWLYKAGVSELSPGNIVNSQEIYSRDVYSFWSPLDRQFLVLLPDITPSCVSDEEAIG